ncbi:MAG: hypothetical protein JNM75_07540 [Rhodospirillales bacterium]|nr:hypothetical protein [Rhodospirillales bacterium]
MEDRFTVGQAGTRIGAGAADLLADIPLLDAVKGGPLSLLERESERLMPLLLAARRRYGTVALRLGDRATRHWLARSRNPYSRELAAVAARVGTPGALLLNLSYEWACTSGVAADPAADPGTGGSRMLRTLDWPMNEIGRAVIVAAQDGGAGIYYTVTWPGYIGVLTAMAPGRFAIAINQPPMRRHSGALWLDWVVNRTSVWRGLSLPPSHLARAVCDTAATYAEARRQLIETPLCIPAFYTLAGAAAGEGCVIERTESRAAVHDQPAAIANHWLRLRIPGRDRGTDSRGRREQMTALLDRPAVDDFDWVRPPIMSPTTRLAVVANAAAGTLLVRGYERSAPATRTFNLAGRVPGGTAHTRPGSGPGEKA